MTATGIGYSIESARVAGGDQHAAANVAVNELMARLSHELRTPLNAIIGFSEILETEMLGPVGSARYQSYASHIRESGVNLLAAVETALAITQRLAEERMSATAGSIKS